ncbi:MAG: prephenate dehydrogenase/arogenate dehydrogenase family protein [Pseudomonadota bacterium]
MIEQVLIIGMGLMGGSLAMALKHSKFAKKIVACDNDLNSLKKASQRNIIDEFHKEPDSLLTEETLVVVSVPIGSYSDVFKRLATLNIKNYVLTDVGSTKVSVVKEASEVFGDVPGYFVPAHPIAGKEKSGIDAAQSDLFQGCRVLITPHTNLQTDAKNKVIAMWTAVGSQVEEISIAEHDRLLACTSHLPHMVAYALVDYLSNSPESDAIFKYAAGGFGDLTRVASSSPEMWRDICLANKDEILLTLDSYQVRLGHLRDCIERGDASALLDLFSQAKNTRDKVGN